MKTVSRRNFIRQGALAGLAIGLPGISSFGCGITGSPESTRKYHVFSKHLEWLNYTDMAKAAARMGYDGVDITARPGGHVLPENVERDLPKAVEAVRKQGLICDTITTGLTDPGDPFAEETIKTAAGLGIKQYLFKNIEYDSELGIPENLEIIKNKLQEFVSMNKHFGIRGDYQNHFGTRFGSPVWDLWYVLNELDSEWIGCRYDIYHATVEGSQSWPVTLKAIAPYIRSLDIKDFSWDRETGKKIVNKPIGEGIVDFKKFAGLLSEYNIRGDFTVHFEYPLGGAENGDSEISISPDEVKGAMKKDLLRLKEFF